MPRPAFILWFCLLGLGVMAPAAGLPRVPTDAQEVLEKLPRALAGPAGALSTLQRRWRAQPHDTATGMVLAEALVDLGRAQNDPRPYDRAEGVLARLATRPDAPLPRVLALQATILQARHDFDGARARLDEAVRRAPRDAQAWLTRATIERVQGRYRQARAACARLSGVAEALVTAGCFAAVLRLDGRAPEAGALLEAALAEAKPVQTELRQWALTLQAEIAITLGQPAAATRYFGQALALDARSVYLLLAYADHLLDLGQPDAVLDLLADEARIDGALLRLTLAARASGDARYAGYRREFAARLAASAGSTLHQGEAARFLLHVEARPAAALTLALANWSRQREPADARILLEAAAAAGRPAAADPVRAFLTTHRIPITGHPPITHFAIPDPALPDPGHPPIAPTADFGGDFGTGDFGTPTDSSAASHFRASHYRTPTDFDVHADFGTPTHLPDRSRRTASPAPR